MRDRVYSRRGFCGLLNCTELKLRPLAKIIMLGIIGTTKFNILQVPLSKHAKTKTEGATRPWPRDRVKVGVSFAVFGSGLYKTLHLPSIGA